MGKREMIDRGKKNYLTGVSKIGGKWKECAKQGGMNTAVCLHRAKLEARYDFDLWANRWAASMYKSGDESSGIMPVYED